jgi:hypothetical protein
MLFKILFKDFRLHIPKGVSEWEGYNIAAQKIMKRKKKPYTHILIVYPRGGTVKYEIKSKVT